MLRHILSRRGLILRQIRNYATSPPRTATSTPPVPTTTRAPIPLPKDAQSRFNRVHDRLPKFLRRYTLPLSTAPLTHISAFLILHELTAVIPLFGLAGVFHNTQWMPPFISEGKWVADGVEKFGSWFRKKGWLGEIDEYGVVKAKRGIWWGRGEGSVRIVVELATSYAIVKALLPLRLMFSVWATPAFARVTVVPFTRWFKRVILRRKI